MSAKPEDFPELLVLEQYFESIRDNLPASIKMNEAVTIFDLPMFVEENLRKLQSGSMAYTVARPRYDDLLQIRALLRSRFA